MVVRVSSSSSRSSLSRASLRPTASMIEEFEVEGLLGTIHRSDSIQSAQTFHSALSGDSQLFQSCHSSFVSPLQGDSRSYSKGAPLSRTSTAATILEFPEGPTDPSYGTFDITLPPMQEFSDSESTDSRMTGEDSWIDTAEEMDASMVKPPILNMTFRSPLPDAPDSDEDEDDVGMDTTIVPLPLSYRDSIQSSTSCSSSIPSTSDLSFLLKRPLGNASGSAPASLRHGPGAPHMPPPGHRSHLGRLSERPNPSRNLTFIESIDELSYDIKTFHANLPSLTPHVQNRQVQNPFLNTLTTPSDSIICVASAVRRTILAATELVLSNLQFRWASSQNYTHLAKGSLAGSGSGSSFTLCEPEVPPATVATFVQEPWVLSPRDFAAFCSLRELRNFVPKFVPNTPAVPNDKPWGQAQQLWAFIHDRCEEQWTHAFITQPYSCSDSRPTIMERTLHWVLSATLQAEHKGNSYIAPRDLPWMNSLYVVSEIVGERSLAIAKSGKRRLQETDDLPIASPIRSSHPSSDRKSTLALRSIHAPTAPPGEPENSTPLLTRPPALVAGVNAWRQRIPLRNKVHNKKRREPSEDSTHDSPTLSTHVMQQFRQRRPFTPSRRTLRSENSPGRLRLPPLLQSPAREGSVGSDHSGDTALDQTDVISMEAVVADVQQPHDITLLSGSGGHTAPELVEDLRSRPPVSIPLEHELFSATPVPLQSPPRGLTSTSRSMPRSSAPRRATRSLDKRLREAHLAGTMSSLTEESGGFSRL
ncbi:hypothetical protein RhiXN_01691 [Rhizoctonia solani]|uniref:Uncharacterized protein n=1 Tax=Rhizoctonia solani TaxID=456999 RepID=A0A8H8PBC2_9AGAM|nr:uncharacterized protein RhiXN_01691 [Rhizoctonia solani]QRW27096.1 hypothetical protein RhiXN_01691 [Rhizoctonia solani]